MSVSGKFKRVVQAETLMDEIENSVFVSQEEDGIKNDGHFISEYFKNNRFGRGLARVCEWHCKGRGAVLFVSPVFAEELKDLVGLEVESFSWGQADEGMSRVRDGKIIAELVQPLPNPLKPPVALGLVVSKKVAHDAVQEIKGQMGEATNVLARLERFMNDHNLTPDNFTQMLDGIDAMPEQIDMLTRPEGGHHI